MSNRFPPMHRRHLGDLPKPDAELISGISPTIAIEQKTAGRNPRSTVGTMTGIYDFMRVLFASIGDCPLPCQRRGRHPAKRRTNLAHDP